ncbi:MAG: Lrp/AsnC family transcriptional regulator [Paracoccaceae bacterium]|nr:Lrp/AsnC family transcriptional regulator [Paracoccaceae bacterium]MDE2673958.1 Lrp/AsnC family transcriptional regulator [Paracoccaceae bacterium]MXZ50339.1 Lrp/AsnC family transcriptional regulator [Paracoccaceae bacterium]MYF47135.1 Lrp/AsnC family transcriptional regulator [Paracoccaceae bacterium]MYI90498.1 Lrp/AsnC family transcriptional regulator [Paracoccaceae bacterium]
MDRIDLVDRMILMELQKNSNQPLDQIAEAVGKSKTPVWLRMKRLAEKGVIKKFTVDVDFEKIGFEACFFVFIKTSEHEAGWQKQFLKAIRDRPEVLEAHRLAGDIDYILKVRVENAKAYDKFYQELIKQVKIYNVTALISMEEIKSTNELNLTSVAVLEKSQEDE